MSDWVAADELAGRDSCKKSEEKKCEAMLLNWQLNTQEADAP